jgi:hypothetical protein
MQENEKKAITRSEGPVSKSSYFLGDPPPDPHFLASLGALPSATGYNHTKARTKRGLGEDPPGSKNT